MKLLIHHHTEAYIDQNGIWLQSFIGAWVSEIAKNTEVIGLLLHTTLTRNSKLDYCISDANVKIESLGPNLGLKNRSKRLRSIKRKCKSLRGYTHLIIRGVTPRQLLVAKNCRITKKFFIFVGCLQDSESFAINGIAPLILFLTKKYRKIELKKLKTLASFSANSPKTVMELDSSLNIKSTFIPTNTISLRDFKIDRRKSQSEGLRILFVGRVTKDKGIEELLVAFERFKKRVKFDNVFLDVVGAYSRDYHKFLKNNYSMTGVEFFGFIPFGSDLFKFYDRSDIYILPSYHEGFPHSIWEAAARKIPVICTPVGGIPGLVDESMVRFVEPKNVGSIYHAIKDVFSGCEGTDLKSENLWITAKGYSLEQSASKLTNWMAL